MHLRKLFSSSRIIKSSSRADEILTLTVIFVSILLKVWNHPLQDYFTMFDSWDKVVRLLLFQPPPSNIRADTTRTNHRPLLSLYFFILDCFQFFLYDFSPHILLSSFPSCIMKIKTRRHLLYVCSTGGHCIETPRLSHPFLLCSAGGLSSWNDSALTGQIALKPGSPRQPPACWGMLESGALYLDSFWLMDLSLPLSEQLSEGRQSRSSL